MVSLEKNTLIVYIGVLLAVSFQGVIGDYNHYNDYENNHYNSFGGSLNPTEGGATWCYQCTSVKDKDCAHIPANDEEKYHYKPCLDTEKYNGSQPFCRKIVQKITVRDNMEIVIRKCGWVRHPRLDCYTMKNEDHEETICQCFELGCNNSPSLQHLGPLTLSFTGLLVYLRSGGQ